MKNLCLLFSLFPVFVWGQVEINFEKGLPDRHFQIPEHRWGVNSSNPLSGVLSLQHEYDNPESDTDAILFSVPLSDMDSAYSCSFMLQYLHKPSASNNWCFYFLAEGKCENYRRSRALALGVNCTGQDDSLYFYLIDNEIVMPLYNTGINFEMDIGNSVSYFEISWLKDQFLMLRDRFSGDTLFFQSSIDLPDIFPCFMGITYSYTSSKDRLLKADEIYFDYSPLIDTLSPILTGTGIRDAATYVLFFNEDLFCTDDFLQYTISPKADSVTIAGNQLIIHFRKPHTGFMEAEITIAGIGDRSGNEVLIDSSFIFYYPGYQDVLISEVMADPSPSVYLPEKEYLELYNRTDYRINLEDWELICGNSSFVLPPFTLEAEEYVIISSEDYKYNSSGQYNSLPVFSSSVIGNSKSLISLLNANDTVIDAFMYRESMLEDGKLSGGWSVERVDSENLCGGDRNWACSINHLGGTPGFQNSVWGISDDVRGPAINTIVFKEKGIFIVEFNETLDRAFFQENISRIKSTNPEIKSLQLIPPLFNQFEIKVSESGLFLFDAIWRDNCGNSDPGTDSICLVSPAGLFPGAIIITEVLFSPLPACPEFIEIYNVSDSVFRLDDLKILTGSIDGSEVSAQFIIEEGRLFFPGSYLILSERPAKLSDYYYLPEDCQWVAMECLPAMNNEGGRVAIYDRGNLLIDEMRYSREDHFPLLNDFSGVSLERQVLDSQPGLKSFWHSASSFCGYATPGYRNSQTQNPEFQDAELVSAYEVFTPDNDGNKDVARFTCHMEKEGYVGTIRIFDSAGREVSSIANNYLFGTENVIIWDGIDNNGQLCSSGIYLLYIEACHLSGMKKQLRETIVLGRR